MAVDKLWIDRYPAVIASAPYFFGKNNDYFYLVRR